MNSMSILAVQNYNWADFAIIGIVVVSALISLKRGFVREAISLATWIIAIWIALRLFVFVATLLTPYIHSHELRNVVAFGGIFLIVLIIGSLINFLFSRLIDRTGLSGSDRILGLVFGIARGILLVGILVLMGNIISLMHDPWWTNSQLIPHFQGLAKWLQGFVPQQISYLSHEIMKQI